jgi:hypothetical protein
MVAPRQVGGVNPRSFLMLTPTRFALAAAAALFAASLPHAVLAQTEEAKVKCAGVNSCKGTSDCKTAKSSCKGQNACKGQGWQFRKSADECTKEGGTVVGEGK